MRERTGQGRWVEPGSPEAYWDRLETYLAKAKNLENGFMRIPPDMKLAVLADLRDQIEFDLVRRDLLRGDGRRHRRYKAREPQIHSGEIKVWDSLQRSSAWLSWGLHLLPEREKAAQKLTDHLLWLEQLG